MRLRWVLLLLALPLADAALLAIIAASGIADWPLLVLIVVLTGLIGMLLVRAEGRRTLSRLRKSVTAGSPPTDELLDGGLLIAAGALLLTPGFVSDALGFLFVVPLTRVPIRMAIKRWIVVPYVDRTTGGFATGTIYTGGFPDGDAGGGTGGVTFGPGTPDDPDGPDGSPDPSSAQSTDAYRIEFDDGEGNA